MRTSSGTRSVGHVRVVSANKLANNEESYPAVAKYTGTYAYQGAKATSGDTKKIPLDATANTPTAPNLEVIGEHGNFWLVKVRKATLSWPLLLERTEIRLVEKIYSKAKPNADPVEKQNISRVVWPTPSRNIPNSQWDYWGWRLSPTRQTLWFHNGVDINAGLDYDGGETINNTDIPIVAIMDGKIVCVHEWDGTKDDARGHTVILEHEVAGIGKYYTLYQHLRKKANETLPAVGTRIYAGDPILLFMGNTGNTTGPHLHFELMRYTNSMTTTRVGSSTYSVNPLKTYVNRDKRDNRTHITRPTYNPQPFFKWNDTNNKFKFNLSFDWTYTQPDSNTTVSINNDKSPVKYSHNDYYKD